MPRPRVGVDRSEDSYQHNYKKTSKGRASHRRAATKYYSINSTAIIQQQVGHRRNPPQRNPAPTTGPPMLAGCTVAKDLACSALVSLATPIVPGESSGLQERDDTGRENMASVHASLSDDALATIHAWRAAVSRPRLQPRFRPVYYDQVQWAQQDPRIVQQEKDGAAWLEKMRGTYGPSVATDIILSTSAVALGEKYGPQVLKDISFLVVDLATMHAHLPTALHSTDVVEAQIRADNLELVFLPLLYHPAIYSLPPHSHPIPTVSRKSSMSTTVTRVYCVPKFYPSHGHADTYQHDRSTEGRYYVVSVGRSIGVYTSPEAANRQTSGFAGAQQRMCRVWSGDAGVLVLWRQLCGVYHTEGCPTPIIPEGWTAPTAVNRTFTPVSANSVPAHPSPAPNQGAIDANSVQPHTAVPPNATTHADTVLSTVVYISDEESEVDGDEVVELWAVEGVLRRLFTNLAHARLARGLVDTTTLSSNVMCSTNLEELHRFSKGRLGRLEAEDVEPQLLWAVNGLRQRLFTCLEQARLASQHSHADIMASSEVDELKRFAEGQLF